MCGKILTPLDGSSLAESAVPHDIEISRATRAEIMLLSVVRDPLAAVPEAAAVRWGSLLVGRGTSRLSTADKDSTRNAV